MGDRAWKPPGAGTQTEAGGEPADVPAGSIWAAGETPPSTAADVVACGACGAKMPVAFRFCGQCGSNLATSRNSTSGWVERRQVTVMFCDIVGSTALSRRFDPETYHTVLDAYLQACAPVIHRYGGVVARCEGDGLLALFGYPQAHEDDPYRAVRSGLGMIATIRDLNQRQLRPMGVCLQVRIGIHSGLAVVGEMGRGETFDTMSVVGETANVAARLQELAEADTVVVSEPTRLLVSGNVRTRCLGLHPIKGLPEPMLLHRALDARAAPTRADPGRGGPLPLIGRQPDLQMLKDAWREVAAGAGRIVILMGEAGIGKSRLIKALKDQLRDGEHASLEFRCSQYFTHTAFFPVIDLLHRRLRLGADEDPNQVRRRLTENLAPYLPRQPDAVDLLERLVSGPGTEVEPAVAEQHKRATITVLASLVSAVAARDPLLLIVEDAHWADPSTLEFLDELARRGGPPRVLCLFSCRPDFGPRWQGCQHVAWHELSRLDSDLTERLIRSVPGAASISEDLVGHIVGRTDGIPLFVEELTRMLVEQMGGDVPRSGAGPYLNEIARAIPDTLQGLLTARLDRLGPAKALAQLAAAIGREFSYGLISTISGMPETELQDGLAQLTRKGLLWQAGVGPDAVYHFRHTLVQDAAYATILLKRRAEIHGRIADALTTRFPRLAELQPELVARHLTWAGDADRAVVYWRAAADRSLNASAHLEAIKHFRQAIEQLEIIPHTLMRDRQELALQKGLAVALRATRGYGAEEVETAYARAEKLCRRLSASSRELFSVIGGLQSVYQLRGPMRRAHDLARQLLELAREIGDERLILQADRRIGWCWFCQGELLRGRGPLERASASEPRTRDGSARATPGSDPEVIAMVNLAWLEWFLGYAERARKRSRAARLLAKELSLPLTRAYAISMSSAIHQGLGDASSTRRLVEAAIAVSREYGFPYWQAWAKTLCGWSLAKMGRSSDGIATIEDGLNDYRMTGAELFRPYVLGLLAEVHLDAGNAEAALECIADGLVSGDASGVHFYDAELHRLRGDAWLRSSGDAVRADASYGRAIDIARAQGARALLLRGLMARAQLPERRDSARDLVDLE